MAKGEIGFRAGHLTGQASLFSSVEGHAAALSFVDGAESTLVAYLNVILDARAQTDRPRARATQRYCWIAFLALNSPKEDSSDSHGSRASTFHSAAQQQLFRDVAPVHRQAKAQASLLQPIDDRQLDLCCRHDGLLDDPVDVFWPEGSSQVKQQQGF